MDVCINCGLEIAPGESCSDTECSLKTKQQSLQEKLLKITSTSKELSEDEKMEVLDIVAQLQEVASELLELLVGEDEDESESEDKSVEKLRSIVETKSLSHSIKEDGSAQSSADLTFIKRSQEYKASDEDLLKINKLSLIPLKAEDVYVFELQSADDQVDRSYEHFSTKALKSMAELAVKNKIPFITEGDHDHQHRQKNVYGVVFDAQVKSGKLLYKTYIPNIPRNKNVLDAILTGLYSKLSVGFRMNPYKDFICDSCNKSLYSESCPHFPGGVDEKGKLVTATIKDVTDNFEISGVAVPCQTEAHIRGGKSAELKSVEAASKSFESSILGIASVLENTQNSLENSNIDTMNIGIDNMEKSSEMDEQEKTLDETKETKTPETSNEETVTKQEETSESKTSKSEDVNIEDLVKAEVEKALASLKEGLVNEISVKVEPVKVDNSEIETSVKSLIEKLAAVEAKLDEALNASEGSIEKKLSEQEKETEPTVRKSWVHDVFGIDLGGQE